jgi:hypothetical protein
MSASVEKFSHYHNLITNNQCPYCLEHGIVWYEGKRGDQCSECKNIFTYQNEVIVHDCGHKKIDCCCVKSQQKMTINLFDNYSDSTDNVSIRESEGETLIECWHYKNGSWEFIY